MKAVRWYTYQMANETREKSLMIRLSEEERGALERVSDHHGLSLSDTVRQLIRTEMERIQPKVGKTWKIKLGKK